jgi:hypothetical protein
MAFPSERGTANATLVDLTDPPTVASNRGTANVTLFDPAGDVPILPSLRGTRNVTLFEPAPEPVAFPSARGVANGTVTPLLADSSVVRLVVVSSGEWVSPLKWCRFVARVSGSWVFL